MTKAQGIHHIAFSTADMKGQIEFFSDVLAMPLVASLSSHAQSECLLASGRDLAAPCSFSRAAAHSHEASAPSTRPLKEAHAPAAP